MKRGIEPDLQVISRGLTAEQSKALSNTIFGILNHLDRKAGFDFRRLHRIILTDDFAKELAGLSANTPSGNAIEYTDEKYAQAIAKVVPLRHAEDFEFVMVFKLEYVCSLMDEVKDDERPSEGYSFALHCVHHEFCHIHDYNKKLDALPSYILRVSPTGKNRFTDNLAWTCWSEYFAKWCIR